MKLNKLVIERVGPFEYYELSFPREDNICMLLTGRNNQGKSMIINALKLLHSATKVAKRDKRPRSQQLLKRDTEHLDIGRLIHNYEGGVAEIRGIFSNGAEIAVKLDESINSVYCHYSANVPKDASEIFGFIPPLGPLAEEESLISNLWHLRASLNSTLAPRHLRNHFRHFLTEAQFSLVKTIVNESWEDIELFDSEHDIGSNKLYCFYKEKGDVREVSWAGQGLQVWFQIITHLVRLMDTSILVLDEPEIFLHMQKQNDLIQILREYYDGSIIMATHSVELMNNVDISHIINVRKTETRPTIKSTRDRKFLESVRSQVGSSFNLIASQFEDVDILVVTEDKYDFDIISRLANACNFNKRAFNIPIHGFSEHKKSIWYKEAYEKFFGKKIDYSVFLDRDYYPEEYLDEVRSDLAKYKIRTFFTPGKEVENLLLDERLLFQIIPSDGVQDLEKFLEELFDSEYDNCFVSFLSLHEKFPLANRKDAKTVLTQYKPKFDSAWKDRGHRLAIIDGKTALGRIRKFFMDKYNIRLSTQFLINKLTQSEQMNELKKIVAAIYQIEGRP
jgi:energy-coupling factor transporter ATP-binding protein EcfA2